jgi:hypothetical protein
LLPGADEGPCCCQGTPMGEWPVGAVQTGRVAMPRLGEPQHLWIEHARRRVRRSFPSARQPSTARGSARRLCRGTRWVPGWCQEPMGPPACCRTPEGESLLCGPGAAGTDFPPCRAATPCGSNMLGPRFRRFFSRGPTTRCASPLPRNPHGSLVGPGTHGSPCLLGTPRGGSPCLRPRRGENRLPAWQSRNTLWIETGRVPGPRRVPSVVERSHIVTFATALKVERFVPLKPSVPW